MKAFVFPGQGSQAKGMGKALFSEFKELTHKADSILGYSIQSLCLDNPDNQLARTDFAQPALFVVNALSYLKKIKEIKTEPSFLAGHSLGEFSALYASGLFDFETGLKIVQERGRLMAEEKKGGMAAVIGLDKKSIDWVMDDPSLKHLYIANYNSPEQFVISGNKTNLEKAALKIKALGGIWVMLNVSGAFHSPIMASAKADFSNYLKSVSLGQLNIPVVSNVTGRFHKEGELKKRLCEQIVSPVQWTESITHMMEKGAITFESIGPGTVLTKLIEKIQGHVGKHISKKRKPVFVSPQKEASIQYKVPKSDGNRNFIKATLLGSEGFRRKFGLKYAYITGAMVRGIASKKVVIAMGNAGMMGFFGTGGLSLKEVETAIFDIQSEIKGKPFGMNFLHNHLMPESEEALTDLFLKYEIKNIEAAAFMQMTPALVRYRLAGLYQTSDGSVRCGNKMIGKLSRPEVATAFLSPAPEKIVQNLVNSGKITKEQAELSKKVPMADAICVEADSGGHTDMGVASALMPAIIQLKNKMKQIHGYEHTVYIGSAGGIGTPEAAAAAFILGADFILTGSINQCTVEAGTSDLAKDLLQEMNVQDTDYAPAGDMFELGSKIQVLKRGLFFPARANKLYDLYRYHTSLDEIDEKTKNQLQKSYFKRGFNEIYNETKAYFEKRDPKEIEKAARNPKHKMALIFRWYFSYSNRVALEGKKDDRVNFQIHTGPALGAFNQWVKGTYLEKWKNRHVDEIGMKLMTETSQLLEDRFVQLGRMLSLN